MSDQRDVIRHSEFLNRLVFDRRTTAELGRVERIWMHPPAHRVLGFICKSGPLGAKRLAFNLQQLKKLGRESIVVDSQPVETNATEVGHLETLIGTELWTDGGDKLGKITDCLFNRHTGVISDYLCKTEGWQGFTGEVFCLPTGQIITFGKKRVLVAEATASHFLTYQAGLDKRLSQATDHLAERYSVMGQELQGSWAELQHTFTDQAQAIGRRAQGQLQHWTDTASHQMETLAHQASETAQTVGEQLTTETQNWVQATQQRGRSLLDNLQDQLDPPLSLDMDPASDPFDDDIWPDCDSEPDPDPPPSPAPSVKEASLASPQSQKSSGPESQPEQDWSFGLGDVAPEDLEEEDPWL